MQEDTGGLYPGGHCPRGHWRTLPGGHCAGALPYLVQQACVTLVSKNWSSFPHFNACFVVMGPKATTLVFEVEVHVTRASMCDARFQKLKLVSSFSCLFRGYGTKSNNFGF